MRSTAGGEAKPLREQRYRELFRYAPEGLLSLDMEGRVLEVGGSCGELLPGHHAEDLRGIHLSQLAPSGEAGEVSRALRHAFGGNLQEMEISCAGGRRLHLTLVPARTGEGIVGVSVVVRDVTGRRALEEQLLREALMDPLTGLLNRTLFVDRLEHAVHRARARGEGLAVLFMDLDGFKEINDSSGHEAGDKVLREVARRLRRGLRPGDTAARLGGDEFGILLEDSRAPEALRVARRLLEDLREPVATGTDRLHLSASVGIATGCPEECSALHLLRKADLAMYRAKQGGKNRCEVFDPAATPRDLEQAGIREALERAMSQGEFTVHYQPIVSLKSGRPVAVEALARWKHQHLGLMLPDQFILSAEQTGMIVPLGQLVLEEACRAVARWRRRGKRLRLGINLSPRELWQQDLPERVVGALKRAGLGPEDLQLELGESALLQEPEAAAGLLRRLERIGVGVVVDDFGGDRSSLGLLKRLPRDGLKLDRSLIRSLERSGEDAEIARALIDLAHRLGMQVTAKGVETEEQAALLRGMGCDLAQGHFFSPPLPEQDLPSVEGGSQGRKKSALVLPRPSSTGHAPSGA